MADIFKRTFKILELYPSKMNIYGDSGNAIAIQKRFEMYGFKARRVAFEIGDEFPKDVDIILAGGGQDAQQKQIAQDLQRIKEPLIAKFEKGVPALAICGAFQLFAKYFEFQDGSKIDGIGFFDAYTVAKPDRLIGNIVTRSNRFGTLIGYENHSGQTFIDDNSQTNLLAETVEKGAGNNVKNAGEGAIKNNVIGTYLHGAFLPKNPRVADFLVTKAVSNRVKKEVTLESAKARKMDELALKARIVAQSRPR